MALMMSRNLSGFFECGPTSASMTLDGTAPVGGS
jgi:hypothetical protein